MARPTPEEPNDLYDDEAWPEEEPQPRRGGVTMRHPVLLVAVLVGSVFLSFQTWQRVQHRFEVQEVLDCGDLNQRPYQDGAQPLPHDRWCTLTGIIQSPTVLATGEPTETTNPYKRHAGRRFYVRLDGAKVWAVLPGDREDVVDYRARKGSLFGYEVKTAGHMIDPDQDPRLKRTGDVLKVKWGEPRDAEIRIFDTTEGPGSPWPYVGMLALLAVTALLALYGLVRVARRRAEDAPGALA